MKLVKINSLDLTRKAPAEYDRRARQAAWADYDPHQEGYRPLTGDGTTRRRDLAPISQTLMQELAYYLYDTSPLTKRYCADTTNFVLGEGVTYSVDDDRPDGGAQQCLDDFWNDPINQMDIRMEDRIEFFCLLGELCLPVEVKNGRVWLSYIDPANITAVTTLQGFPEIPSAVRLMGTGGSTSGGPLLNCVLPDMTMGPNRGRRSGECFFWALNKPPNATRGRSDLIHLFDFLDAFEHSLFDEVDRLKLIRSFVWDVTLNGADEADIKAFLSKNKIPMPGSVRAHNESVQWQAVSPDLKHVDTKTFYDLLRTYIAAGMNRPDSWFGSGGKAYQTEADLMAEPTMKSLSARQRRVRYIYEEILGFVLDQAIMARALPPPEEGPSYYTVNVDMPNVTSTATDETVTALQTLARALVAAEGQGWVTKEDAARLFVNVAGRLGTDIDIAEEMISEAADGVTEDYQQVTAPAPEPGESDGSGGV